MAGNTGEDLGRCSHKESVRKPTSACQDITTLAEHTPPAGTPCSYLTGTCHKASCEQAQISSAAAHSEADTGTAVCKVSPKSGLYLG